MMALSAWELLDLAGSPRNPSGELRLIRRLLDLGLELGQPAAVPAAKSLPVPVGRPALTRAA
jgi:hypothetical protein